MLNGDYLAMGCRLAVCDCRLSLSVNRARCANWLPHSGTEGPILQILLIHGCSALKKRFKMMDETFPNTRTVTHLCGVLSRR